MIFFVWTPREGALILQGKDLLWKESGSGRADIIMIPKVGKEDEAIIIEYKIAKNTEDLALVVRTGIKQIIDRQYDVKVKEHYHVKKIIRPPSKLYFC